MKIENRHQSTMAILSTSLSPFTSSPSSLSSSTSNTCLCNFPYSSSSSSSSSSSLSSPNPNKKFHHHHHRQHLLLLLKHRHSSISSETSRASYRYSSGFFEDEEDERGHNGSFEEAVSLFNGGDYYRCHDSLEALWLRSQDPLRTLFHGILQCAVGFHHLFNQEPDRNETWFEPDHVMRIQKEAIKLLERSGYANANHRGAMMELGEGLCKLRKMNFDNGPFHQFEQEISAVLEFIYKTQLELAACAEDYCLAMDQSERSYQLLGGYAAGQRLYQLEGDSNGTMFIAFHSERSYGSGKPQMVKLPILRASAEHLVDFDYD